jgi:hypothetical protein
MKRIARHVRGHVIAYLALFLVLSGTAVAAVQALPKNSITSKQIKNGTILKADLAKSTITALKGNRGPAGPQGSAGPAGPAGAAGPAGPLLTTLPSGQSLVGDFAGHSGGASIAYASISFQFPLAAAPTTTFIAAGTTPPAQCPGTVAEPKASPGNLCIYVSASAGGFQGYFSPTVGSNFTPSRFGVVVFDNTTDPYTYGTWAVTAP